MFGNDPRARVTACQSPVGRHDDRGQIYDDDRDGFHDERDERGSVRIRLYLQVTVHGAVDPNVQRVGRLVAQLQTRRAHAFARDPTVDRDGHRSVATRHDDFCAGGNQSVRRVKLSVFLNQHLLRRRIDVKFSYVRALSVFDFSLW